MSFKGFTKGVGRAPTLMKKKLNMGTTAEDDPVFIDAERRFKEFETETKRLTDESHKYFKAVDGLLDHQIGFSKGIEDVYKPISGKASDPNRDIPEDSPEGLEASQAYQSLVVEMKETLAPDLRLIEDRIIKPAKDLLEVIQTVRKMLTKRNRKKIDLDRHVDSMTKIENKKERTPKDEERLYKAQANVEMAQQEFDYFNEICKNELPHLFHLEAEFIKPLFVSFYYMQLNIFYTLYTRMEELKIPYFDLQSDVVERFYAKRGNIEEITDAIGIVNFKQNFARTKLDLTKKKYGKEDDESSEGGYSSPSTTGTYGAPPPAYSASHNTVFPAGHTTTPSYGTAPPQPAITTPGIEYCTALYNYTAQAKGDLSFSAGSVIQIVQRTPDQNGWWTGIYNGQQGIFPGNYVQLN